MYRVKACWVCSGVSGRVVEQLDASGQVADGFQIRRAVARVLARPLPVGNGLLREARLRVVVRQQFRLRLRRVGKPLRQHLRNALMVLLTCTPQQRLIGRHPG